MNGGGAVAVSGGGGGGGDLSKHLSCAFTQTREKKTLRFFGIRLSSGAGRVIQNSFMRFQFIAFGLSLSLD